MYILCMYTNTNSEPYQIVFCAEFRLLTQKTNSVYRTKKNPRFCLFTWWNRTNFAPVSWKFGRYRENGV